MDTRPPLDTTVELAVPADTMSSSPPLTMVLSTLPPDLTTSLPPDRTDTFWIEPDTASIICPPLTISPLLADGTTRNNAKVVEVKVALVAETVIVRCPPISVSSLDNWPTSKMISTCSANPVLGWKSAVV
jgi:hypothetical protein